MFAFYQPIVCSQTGEILGREALMRLKHKDRFLLPNQFMDTAVQRGVYPKLVDDFLDQVCIQFAGTNNSFSFNLFVRDILDDDFRERVIARLLDAGIASQARLEVLEWDDTDDYDALYAALEQFHYCGVSIALDDFFEKYSDYRRLCNLQRAIHEECERLFKRGNLVAYVKIDRSKIQGIAGNEALFEEVNSIAALLKQWGMKMVAEGVEKEEDFHVLQNLGKSLQLEIGIQGWFFGRASLMPYELDNSKLSLFHNRAEQL